MKVITFCSCLSWKPGNESITLHGGHSLLFFCPVRTCHSIISMQASDPIAKPLMVTSVRVVFAIHVHVYEICMHVVYVPHYDC